MSTSFNECTRVCKKHTNLYHQQTVQVSRDALMILSQESLEKPSSIQRLEEAATELYKALQAGRDTGWDMQL